jgi:hypothetical protein
MVPCNPAVSPVTALSLGACCLKHGATAAMAILERSACILIRLYACSDMLFKHTVAIILFLVANVAHATVNRGLPPTSASVCVSGSLVMYDVAHLYMQ